MKQESTKINRITEGVIWKQLLIFFFPIVFGTFFQQLYTTVDTMIVGHFIGKDALASVGGSATQIISLIMGLFAGISSGAAVTISQAIGARNDQAVSHGIHTAYASSIVGSVVVSILGLIFAPHMLSLMRTPPELMAETTLYLRICFAGLIFVFIYNMGSSLLRAAGDSKNPLYCLILCCFVNIALDILFVVYLHLGVAGAAIATLIAQAISAALVTWLLMRSGNTLALSLPQIRFYGPMLGSQLRIGMPTGLQSVMYSISNVLIQTALNNFGTDTVAAWSVYGKLDALFWMVSMAFGIAITTFVGQNYGAGKTDRVKKSVRVCLGIDLLCSTALILFLITARTPLFRLFTADENVVRLGADMLSLITPCYIFFVFIEILSGALRGVGDVVIPLGLTLFGTCLLRIGWVFGASRIHPTVEAIIFSYPVTWLLTALLFIGYYLYRRRKI